MFLSNLLENKLFQKLNQNERTLYVVMAWRADKEKKMFSSYDKFAIDCAMSKSTVQRTLKKLIEYGIIKVLVKGTYKGEASMYRVKDILKLKYVKTDKIESDNCSQGDHSEQPDYSQGDHSTVVRVNTVLWSQGPQYYGQGEPTITPCNNIPESESLKDKENEVPSSLPQGDSRNVQPIQKPLDPPITSRENIDKEKIAEPMGEPKRKDSIQTQRDFFAAIKLPGQESTPVKHEWQVTPEESEQVMISPFDYPDEQIDQDDQDENEEF